MIGKFTLLIIDRTHPLAGFLRSIESVSNHCTINYTRENTSEQTSSFQYKFIYKFYSKNGTAKESAQTDDGEETSGAH